MTCSVEQKISILDLINDTILFSNENINKNLIESTIEQSGILRNSEEGKFTLSGFLSNLSDDELSDLKGLMEQSGLDVSDFLETTKSTITANKCNVISKLYSPSNVLDLFHNQSYLEKKFINWVTPKIAQSIFIGNKSSNSYVKNDKDVTTNFNIMKQSAFNYLIHYFQTNKINGKYLIDPERKLSLFGVNNSVNYSDYLEVMKISNNYFLNQDNFPSMTKSYITGRILPVMPFDNDNLVDAYFNTILLNNFDHVITQIGNSVKVDYKSIGSLNTDNVLKYQRTSKGLITEYWSNGSHESEGSENHEDDLTKMVISAIPAYKKDGKTKDGVLEIKQLYLLGSRIAKFELTNYKWLKQTYPGFTTFNQDSNKALDFYMNLLTSKDNIDSKFLKLYEIKEVFHSLKNFFEHYNIAEKEKNAQLSLKGIITQVINNNKGGVYSVYNANGTLDIKEIANYDFQVAEFHKWTYNALGRNIKSLYDKNQVDELFNGFENINVNEIPNKFKSKFGTFMKKRFGSGLNSNTFDLMINDLVNQSKGNSIKFETTNDLKSALNTFLIGASKDWELIKTQREVNKRFDENKAGDLIKNITANSLYIAFRNGYLENYVVRPQMNFATASGEKIPTFKLSNLTYKDLELFEVHELNKRLDDSYKSLLINHDGDESVLLGTQTKLEGVSPDGNRNKSAGKFNVTESFKSNFLFDFLKQMTIKPHDSNRSFAVMIGNYSDKSTVLLKTINADYVRNGQKVISLSDADLKDLVRKQAFDFYNDSVNTVISDFKKVLEATTDYKISAVDRNSKTEDILKAFNTIDEILAKLKEDKIDIYNLNKLYKETTGENSPLMEELHYTKYDRVTTNRYLLSNYVVMSSKKNFEIFTKRVENKFIEDYKDLCSSDGLLQIPSELSGDLDSLTKSENLNVNIKDFKSGNNLLISKDGELNPLIQKYIWLNSLYRNEYLFITAKGEYLHPHKNGSNYIANPDINSEDFWKSYEKEATGRLGSMAKRNVMFTATIETPIRNSKMGVPEKVNHAVIKDYTDLLVNTSGRVNYSQDVHDGSSMIDYCYSKMVDESYPGKGYSGTKKPFGTFITPNGVVIKKDAESVISNWNIMASRNSLISLKNKKAQMLGINIDSQTINSINLNTSNQDFYYRQGKDLIRIDNVKIKNDESGNIVYSITLKNLSTNKNTVESGQLDKLYTLWEKFGAEYSCDEKGNFNEGSNELLYKIITTVKTPSNHYLLKDKLIHIISNHSAVKAGGLGVNPKSSWKDNSPLNYSTHESRFLGPQLNANHEADESNIKEVTQVISALSQNRDTAHLADEAYSDIAKIIENAASKYTQFINNWSVNPTQTKEELYQYISRKFVRDIQTTPGDSLAKIITQSFEDVSKIPLSNQNFFGGFVKSVIVDLNNNFISRYYSGTGAILLPSHGIVQIYDIPVKTNGIITSYRQVMHNDLVEEALNSELQGTNDEIISQYIQNLLPDEPIEKDRIELGDNVKYILNGKEVFEKLDHPIKYYNFKNNPETINVKKVYNVPRDLKPASFIWTDQNNVQQSAFDTDPVKLRLQNEFGLLSQEDKEFLKLFEQRFNNLPLEKALVKWNQRNLRLLEENRVIKSLQDFRNEGKSNEKIIQLLFGEDNLLNDFNNVRDHYISNEVSKDIFNYKFEPAERIMGDIYQTKFGRKDNDTIAKIQKQGVDYFAQQLKERYDTSFDNPNYNAKLFTKSGETVYIKYDLNTISNDETSLNIEKKQNQNDVTKTDYFILDNQGEELLKIPKKDLNNLIVKNDNGNIVIHIKAYDSDNIMSNELQKTLSRLISENKNELSSIIPIVKNKVSVKKQNGTKLSNFDLNNLTFNIQNSFLGKNYINQDEIIEDLSKKMYASWEKSLEGVASRIPSQSMQSFMPMKTVAYFKSKSNECLVSVHQLWYQGSDLDIDKAYMLGYGFKPNSTIDTSDYFKYSTKSELDEIIKMPIPNGKIITTSQNGIDISNDVMKFAQLSSNNLNSNLDILKLVRNTLNKLNLSNNEIQPINLGEEYELYKNNFIEYLNGYNSDQSYLTAKEHVKNSVVSKINQIISSPTNQVMATTPVDEPVGEIKEAVKVNQSLKEGLKPNILNPYSPLSMFKQQYEAAVGKDDVGISANGLKVFFALSSYYNDYYRNSFNSNNTNFDNHTFKKEFTINGKSYSIGSISDTAISDDQKNHLMNILQLPDSAFRNSDAASYLSGFTSLATD